jgi:hypothetical protein
LPGTRSHPVSFRQPSRLGCSRGLLLCASASRRVRPCRGATFAPLYVLSVGAREGLRLEAEIPRSPSSRPNGVRAGPLCDFSRAGERPWPAARTHGHDPCARCGGVSRTPRRCRSRVGASGGGSPQSRYSESSASAHRAAVRRSITCRRTVPTGKPMGSGRGPNRSRPHARGDEPLHRSASSMARRS